VRRSIAQRGALTDMRLDLTAGQSGEQNPRRVKPDLRGS